MKNLLSSTSSSSSSRNPHQQHQFPVSSTPATGSSSLTAAPSPSRAGLKRGPWTPEEDQVLINYIYKEGEGRWRTLPKKAGLRRCGKSCRLRWMNYLRPSVKRGQIAPDEEDLILRLHRLLGNRWSLIAGRIPGRTDNEIKNYWNTHLSKKLITQGIDPRTHKPLNSSSNRSSNSSSQTPRVSSSNIETKAHAQNDHNTLTPLPDSHGGNDGDGGGLNGDIMNDNNDNNDDDDDVFSSFLNSLINENTLITPSNRFDSAQQYSSNNYFNFYFPNYSEDGDFMLMDTDQWNDAAFMDLFSANLDQANR